MVFIQLLHEHKDKAHFYNMRPIVTPKNRIPLLLTVYSNCELNRVSLIFN